MAIDIELVRVLASLCEQVSGLRDDLYNATALQNGEAFAAAFPIVGEQSFTTSDMPPLAAAIQKEAYKNDTSYPVAVYLRAEPPTPVEPATGLVVESVLLLVSLQKTELTDARAAVCKLSAGEGVTVLAKPGQTIYVSVMASATVNVSWRVIPLRGRKMLGGS